MCFCGVLRLEQERRPEDESTCTARSQSPYGVKRLVAVIKPLTNFGLSLSLSLSLSLPSFIALSLSLSHVSHRHSCIPPGSEKRQQERYFSLKMSIPLSTISISPPFYLIALSIFCHSLSATLSLSPRLSISRALSSIPSLPNPSLPITLYLQLSSQLFLYYL